MNARISFDWRPEASILNPRPASTLVEVGGLWCWGFGILGSRLIRLSTQIHMMRQTRPTGFLCKGALGSSMFVGEDFKISV